MSDPSEEESSSSKAETNIGGGFYDKYRSNRNIETPKRPSFLEDTTTTNVDGVLGTANKQNDLHPRTTLYSVPTSSSVLSTSTFGSLKRKRLPEVVSKPSFKVSELVGATPHLPKFGTSLTKVKFDFTSSNSSVFYSGRTKFGGSSAVREDTAKRIKISPVSYSARTNLTQVSAKPYTRTDNKRTLTSKTAENILKTLDKMCTPVKPPEKQQSYHSEISSSFSSLSRRLREKRKSGMLSLPPPPIARLNQMAPAQISNTKMNVDTRCSETTNSSEIETLQTSEQQAVTNMDNVITKTSENEAVKILEIESVKAPEMKPVATSESPDSKTSESEVVKLSEIKVTKTSKSELGVKPVEVVTNSNTSTESPIINSIANVIQKKDELQSATLNKNGLKMKRQNTRAHYTASEKVEEPVNTMPEVTAIQPMVLSTLPKFDLSVKPSTTPLFTPIAKLPKPVNSIKVVPNDNDGKFVFSTPKMVSDKNIDPPSSDMKYSFISPVSIKNPGTPIITKEAKEKKPKIFGKSNVANPVMDINTPKSDNKSNGGEAIKNTPFKIGFNLPKREEGSWDCPTCMITNKTDCLKCVACTEPKPGSKETASAHPAFSFGKVPSTISDCSPAKKSVASSTFSFASTNVASSTGFTFSKPFSTICSSGFSVGVGKTSDVTSVMSSETEATKTEKSSFSLGKPISSVTSNSNTTDLSTGISEKPLNEVSKPNPFLKIKPVAEGSWECPTCMINNGPDVQKCVACTEPKPGSKVSENTPAPAEFNFGGNVNSTTSGFAFGAATNNTGGFSFGAPVGSSNVSGFSFGKLSDTTSVPNPFTKLAKPAEGSWECPTCMITNQPDCLKCVACTEPKPGAAVDVTKSTEKAPEQPFSFGNSNSSSFSFGTSAKSTSADGFSFQTVAATANPFFKLNKPEEGSWSCPTCMITNKPDCLKCAACTEPKPGSNNLPNTESSIANNPPIPSGFSFGKPSIETNGGSGFSFGSATSKESSGFSFVPSVPSIPSIPTVSSTGSGFSFGKSSNPGSGFSFGNTASNSNPVGFSFGATAQKEITENEVKVTSNIFGSGEDKKIQNDSSTETKPASTGFSFGAVNNAEKPSTEVKPAPTGFSFGAVNNVEKPSNVVKPGATGFSFGAVNSVEKQSTEVQPAAAGFSFGAVNNAEKPSNAVNSNIFSSAVPSFDSSKFNGMPAATVNSTPQFNFASNAKPSFLFENKAPEPAAAAATVKFNFNPSSMSTPNFNFGAASSAAAIFGNPTPTGQFSFANNNNAADGNRDIVHNSVNERRKVRRAHRKLPARK